MSPRMRPEALQRRRWASLFARGWSTFDIAQFYAVPESEVYNALATDWLTPAERKKQAQRVLKRIWGER